MNASSGWFTYGHDGDGNRTSEWLEGTSLSYAYTYDRLKYAATPGATPVKRYSFAYDYQSNLAGIGKYDAAGSTVTSAMCLVHDALGRLVTVGTAKTPTTVTPDAITCTVASHVGTVTARFKYDHRNRRVASWRVETNEWVYTVFDKAGQPLAELAKTTDPANPWRTVREYVWLDGKPVAQIEHDATTGAARVYSVHADAIGLPRALTNPSGATVWSASVARPYGDIAETATPDPETGRTVVTNLRLPGQYDERLLGSLGLQGPYYNWNRWYLPSVGRYLELDPIAKEGSFNTPLGIDWYGYASANPMRFVDPRGLKIRSGGSQGPDRFPAVTCVEGQPGAACLTYDASIGPCVKTADCKYKFDASVNASAWREFVSRDVVNKPSRESRGMTLGQHESLHIGDYLSAYGGNSLDALYQSEGFGSVADCEQARSGLAGWLATYRDGVLAESGGKRDGR